MKFNSPYSSFIKRNLNTPDDVDTDSLKNEYLKLKDENERLKKRIEELTKEVIILNYKI
jgi:hypothetical protein